MNKVENNNIEKENVQIEEMGDENKDVQVYTEDDMRTAYNEGQKTGYTAAVRQIRSAINDYLNDLLITIGVNGQNQKN